MVHGSRGALGFLAHQSCLVLLAHLVIRVIVVIEDDIGIVVIGILLHLRKLIVLLIYQGIELGPCSNLKFLSHTHLLLLIHHVHTLDQRSLGLGRLLHGDKVFVELLKMLGEVTILMGGICLGHIHP